MNTVVREVKLSSGQTIRILRGDITAEQVDAIVNAANSHLKHGGGVAAAIVKKGGEVIQRESDEWVRQYGPVPTGQVAITNAGNLPAKAVIHAVGPVWGEHTPERADELLKSAVLEQSHGSTQQRFYQYRPARYKCGHLWFPERTMRFNPVGHSQRVLREKSREPS